MDFGVYHPALTELSRPPTLYNDAGGQDPTLMTVRPDPRNDYDTSSGLLNLRAQTYQRGLNTSARIRPTNPTQVTLTDRHVYSRVHPQGGQLLLPAWVLVPSYGHTTLALRRQVFGPRNFLFLPGEGMNSDSGLLQTLNEAPPLISEPEHATRIPLSAYQPAQYQILPESYESSMVPAFAQGNPEWKSLLAGDSVSASIPLVPQPTISPLSISSLPSEPMDLGSDADNILFHQQCLEVGRDIFTGQLKSSIQREQPQHHSQTTVQEHFDEDSGALQGTMIVFGAKQKVRSKLSPIARALTAKTRKFGACLRCRKYKQACRPGISPYQPCGSCATLSPSIPRLPCKLRATIDEILLFRLGPPSDNSSHPLNFFKDVFVSLEESRQHFQTRKLCLTQDLGSTLEVAVSPYVPVPGDKTAYEWKTKDGVHKMEMPRYCLSDVEEVKSRMLEYNYVSGLSYLQNLLDSSNKILWNTFEIALRSGKPLVRQALKLWTTSRLIERTWRLCGEDTLGLEPVSDDLSAWAGIIPVTPLMDQQLDQIVIQWILKPLKQSILASLKRLTKERTKENLFEIYLTTFILLNNSEVQLAHARQFAQRYGMSGRYGPYGKYKESENQFHAARTMLAHFHHIFGGSVFLRVDWTSTYSLQYAKLDKEQIEYMVRLKDHIKDKEPAMRDLRVGNQYETDLYWCSQLFDDGWEPGHGYIEELPTEELNNMSAPEIT